MNTKRQTLELTCNITDFSIHYAEGKKIWHERNAKVSIVHDDNRQIGTITVWEEGIAPDSIKEYWSVLIEQVEHFVLGMKFIGNRRIASNEANLVYYINDDEPFHIRNELDIEAAIRRSRGEAFNYMNAELPGLECKIVINSSPVALPDRMPFVPLCLRKHILTVIQAEDLEGYSVDYSDEKLKRWFLILEELETNTNLPGFKAIKCLRHFVSHSVCHGPEVLTFLKGELPSAVYKNSDGGEEARFLRDDPSHMSLVSKYEMEARDWARKLVKREIMGTGGCV